MVWPDASEPFNMHASTDLMLLHPNGKDELLVAGAPGAIADPYVSFDAQWVYYTHFRDLTGRGGADVYKVNVKTRKMVRLTQQQWTRNTGVSQAAKASSPDGVYNMHPCPLPGGKVAFVSNRDGLSAPRRGGGLAMQLFVMDDDGENVEKIGHLNLGSAAPGDLKGWRIIFSSLESQGLRTGLAGVSGAFIPTARTGTRSSVHTRITAAASSISGSTLDGASSSATTTFWRWAGSARSSSPGPPPADTLSRRRVSANGFGTYMGGAASFRPLQALRHEVLTHFIQSHDDSIPLAEPRDPKSPIVGRLTHHAPDNHLLTVWTGPMSPGREFVTADRLLLTSRRWTRAST